MTLQGWLTSGLLLCVALTGCSDGKTTSTAPPKALTPMALDNLTAFTKLLGYVRHFHPSDAVEKVNWDSFAIASVPVAEEAASPTELASKLEALFRPIAPTVRVFVSGNKPVDKITRPAGANQMVVWENVGFGTDTIKQNIYHSKRVFTAIPASGLPAAFEADLGSGVSCVVPLALYATDGSALPKTAVPNLPVPAGPSGDDRNTRLADVALAWNVFEHFYPYFDIVKVDWYEVLRKSLTAAATDPDARAFLDTLRRMVASAADGHGNVYHPSDNAQALTPLLADWVENKLVITAVLGGTTKMRVGDEITRINRKSVEELWAAAEPLISGATPQWRRYRGVAMLLAGGHGSPVSLDLLRGSEKITVDLVRSTVRVVEPRPDAISEIKPGIWYVDLDNGRAKMEDYRKALPNLVKAKGLIFDMRGYPNEVALDVLARATPKPFISAFWNIPKVLAPGKMEFMQSTWPPTGPIEPQFKGKVAFLTDGRAISYAESVMAIVQHYKIGEIVGSTTAGTNGNINPFKLPGGYMVVFTGMKVLRHDGKPHHGVGIAPTIPVSRTINGVRALKDEVLERAIGVVGG